MYCQLSVIISNNQSKDLIVLWWAKLFTPVYMQFPLFLLFGQSGNTAIKEFTCLYISIKIGIRHLC